MRCPAAAPSRGAVAALVVASILFATACTSPEASRTRGGGPGADLGNRADVIEMHAGARPYHATPCVTGPVPCTGPEPVFGTKLPGE